MAPPSNLKPLRKQSSLRLPPSRWKGKSRVRKQTRKHNLNPNFSRGKQRTGNTAWLQEHLYQPPRLQDLQFQNRLKAFSHFDDRYTIAGFNSVRGFSLDGSAAPSLSGFSVPASRIYSADSHVGGVPLDFPIQGSAFSGSLDYPGKGKAAMSSFLVTNAELMVPATLPHANKFDATWLPGISLPSNLSRTTSFAAVQQASRNYAGNAEAFLSGSAPGAPKASTGGASFKRNKASLRTRKAIMGGARKQLGAPAAPRNTTSFLMRARKAGGIASLVSPSPATLTVASTPAVSPFTNFAGLADEANHEWGVNDYGSMNGLIRLRSLDFGLFEYGDGVGDHADSESEVEQGVEFVQQLEQRLDHDVNRFVMTYPTGRPQDMGQNILETRMDDQDSHIAHLEEENLDLKVRLYSMQQEMEDLRRRMRMLQGASSGDEAEAEGSAEGSPERSVVNVPSV